jgi:CRISPR-associated protein Cst2
MKSLTLAGRWNVNLHNLNNEGTEGNFIQPRTVTVVQRTAKHDGEEPEPSLHAVNAISGDMMKHIHADYFRQIALDDGADDLENYNGHLPLSRNSIVLDPNRISTEDEVVEMLGDKNMSNAAIIDYMIEACSLVDTHGILLTKSGRSVPRKSRIEFGWVVAVPKVSQTEHFFHAKYKKENSTRYTHENDDTGKEQKIFHRPASSAEYAVIAHIEADKIGLNEITLESPISEEARRTRVNAVLRALVQTLMHPYGAGRSQQAPHVGGFQGALITSNSRIPASTVSPLESDFMDQVSKTVKHMNRLGGKLQFQEIDSLPTLAEHIADLTEVSA